MSGVTPWVVAVAAALVMEPVAALAHRRLMHGRGWRWHASHHASARGARVAGSASFEANDYFPICFAVATIAAMAVGASVAPLRAVTWVGAGVTAYGAAYLLVHDVCIHGRLEGPLVRGRYLRWVRHAHAIHHRTGAAPYGFLLPVVPRRRRTSRDEVATVSTLRAVGTRTRPAKTS